MTGFTQKLLVVAIGCALTGAVIVWRVRSMREGRDNHRHFDPIIERTGSPPNGLHGSGNWGGAAPISQLTAVKLGSVTYFHDAEELAALEAARKVLLDVRRAHESIDGNAYVLRSMEVDIPDYPKGTGKQITDVYFVTTGPLPSRLNAATGSLWPLVTSLQAGKSAERAGLRVGDVILAVEGASTEGIWPNEAIAAVPIGSTVKLSLSRKGEDTTLSVAKTETLLGYGFILAPYEGPGT